MIDEEPQATPAQQLSEDEAREILRCLLHKQGTWVDWGKACQKLHQAGYSAQTIFEETGFQASQQNLVVVASQVYESLLRENTPSEILDYFQGPRSDILHEFRVLNQQQRKIVAELAYQKRLEVDEARELARAVQEFSRLPQLPPEFTAHPGDALAHQCWRQARQKKDLQERSRLIAKGLKFANSQAARAAIEKLLSDFTVYPPRQAPLMPVYRLEVEEQLARMVPYLGRLPISQEAIESVEPITTEEPFQIVTYSGQGSLVPLPGWQAILKAIDPIAILTSSEELPTPFSGRAEDVLAIVDRARQEWDVNSYFLAGRGEILGIHWFAEKPTAPLLGQIILILRPKKILDENNLLEPWQMNE